MRKLLSIESVLWRSRFKSRCYKAERFLSACWTEAEFLDEIQTKFQGDCLEIYISSNSENLFHISSNSCNFLRISTVQLLYFTVLYKRKEETLIENHTLFPMVSEIQKPQVWELWRFCSETSKKLYVHEFGFWRLQVEASSPKLNTLAHPNSYAVFKFLYLSWGVLCAHWKGFCNLKFSGYFNAFMVIVQGEASI